MTTRARPVRHPSPAPTVTRTEGETGSALILALVFLLATGLLTLALATFAVEAETNTTNIRAVGTVNLNAESVAMATIQAVRTSYNFPGTTSYNALGASNPAVVSCAPSQATTSFTVACIGYANPGSIQTRTVDIYVCATANLSAGTPDQVAQACYQTNTALANSTGSKIALSAEVTFDDIPPNQPAAAASCSSTNSSTCGMTMTINHWDVRAADS